MLRSNYSLIHVKCQINGCLSYQVESSMNTESLSVFVYYFLIIYIHGTYYMINKYLLTEFLERVKPMVLSLGDFTPPPKVIFGNILLVTAVETSLTSNG